MYCKHCGVKNGANDRFCSGCAAPMSEIQVVQRVYDAYDSDAISSYKPKRLVQNISKQPDKNKSGIFKGFLLGCGCLAFLAFGGLFLLGLFAIGLNSDDNTITDSSNSISSQTTKEDYISNAVTVNYKEVARNPQNFEGMKVKFTGKVIQATEIGNSITLRVDVTKVDGDYYGDTIYVEYRRSSSSETRILEDDIITLYGDLRGIKTYQAIFGNTVSIPHINAKFIDIIK